MIELHARITARGSSGHVQSKSTPLLSSNGQSHYRLDYDSPRIRLTVDGDDPQIKKLGFRDPEVSLVCRVDLLQTKDGANISEHPAAHLASLYLRHGDNFVDGLRGTFAVILYDHRTGSLKAWTDHFGVQRLVYTDSGEGFSIGTDLRLLLTERPEIDAGVILEYLQYSCIPTPNTIYKGFCKLAPGHQLTYNGHPSVRSYWDMTYNERTDPRAESVWANETVNALRSAVASNLTSLDGQDVGCFLSGGTDSSSVSGMTGKLTGVRPRTFSIGFDDPRYNEIEYARIAAKHFSADHHEYFVKPEDILSLARKAAVAYDEPFGNSSIIPAYYCASLAAEHGVKFLLAGDGGDELFGGNSRYADDRVFDRYKLIPGWIRRFLIEPSVTLGSSSNNKFLRRAASYVRRSNIKLPDRYFSYSLVNSTPSEQLFSPDFAASGAIGQSLAIARQHFRTARAQNDLNRWLYLDLKIVITDNDLRKVTTMSRLAGVTTRYPFLDRELVEFTGTLPVDLKVRGDRLRYLFKKAMENFLPQQIITKSKHGFGLPYSVWLGEHKPLRDFTLDVLGSARCRQRGYFRRDLPEWLWARYETEHRGFYGDMMWVFLMLELWHTLQWDRLVSYTTPAMPTVQL